MLWVGLTGGLGSGKSTVAKILRENGYTVVDADEMARLALRPNSTGWTKVVNHFGAELLKNDGELDRVQLAKIVFHNKQALRELENIVHPLVGALSEEQRAQAEARGETMAFYDVPLLFEKNMQDRFAFVVVVNSPLEMQIERAMKRDSLSREQALARLKNQLPLEEKVKRADFVIENTGSIEDLKKHVDRFLRLKAPRVS